MSKLIEFVWFSNFFRLLAPDAELDSGAAFILVRDMPYRRASDRQPETIIREWQGTCSGKHYLLKALFAELGIESQVMACTTVTSIAEEKIPDDIRALYENANRRFVDVHNYLVVFGPGDTPGFIEKVFADFVGKEVKAGDPLFTLYSPELVSTQQEYLIAVRAQRELKEAPYREVSSGAASLVNAAQSYPLRPLAALQARHRVANRPRHRYASRH